MIWWILGIIGAFILGIIVCAWLLVTAFEETFKRRK
jgi:hypothetical protein